MSYAIFDLDNTLSDDGWRIAAIAWDKKNPMERYHDYHSLSGFDKVGNRSLLEEAIDTGHKIIIFTARPVLYAAVTHEWLARNSIPASHIVMRNNGDHRPSVELKREMLHWLPEHYNVPWREIAVAYDDREDVVAMFKKHHIQGRCVPIHNVCAYTPPVKKEHQ